MSDEAGQSFTGERLHEDDALFAADLLRHRAAYLEAIRVARQHGLREVLELGSGTGYGTAELARALPRVVAVDRVRPADRSQDPQPEQRAHFLVADLEALPLSGRRFDLVLSFQVVEHLVDPTRYLEAIAGHLRPEGIALITTPNRLHSDGENPFHVHEYTAEELTDLLGRHFDEVAMLGVSARGEAARFHEARLARIRRIVRLDPLGLRRKLPHRLIEWLFARAAILLRRSISSGSAPPRVTIEDYPIEPVHRKSLDLLAVCRRPRPTVPELHSSASTPGS